MFCITKWTKAITDSGKDEYTKRIWYRSLRR